MINREELLEQFKIFDNDPLFKFDEPSHTYTYDGNKFISVTQTLSNFHLPFETEKWSTIKAAERGITVEEILKEWKDTNDYANMVGTATHLWIENYFNGIYQELPTNLDIIKRINKFNIIYAERLHKLTPIKNEVRIFSKKWRIAGTVDALFIKDDKLYILDYKTNKKFKGDKDYAYNKLLVPFDFLAQNHENEYSIQLSIYKSILKQYDIFVNEMFLVYIPPDDAPAKIYKAKDLCSIIEPYFDENWNRFEIKH